MPAVVIAIALAIMFAYPLTESRFREIVREVASAASHAQVEAARAALPPGPTTDLTERRHDRRQTPVVTLFESYGSGASYVGPRVAQALGVPFHAQAFSSEEIERAMTERESEGLLSQRLQRHGRLATPASRASPWRWPSRTTTSSSWRTRAWSSRQRARAASSRGATGR